MNVTSTNSAFFVIQQPSLGIPEEPTLDTIARVLDWLYPCPLFWVTGMNRYYWADKPETSSLTNSTVCIVELSVAPSASP